MSIATKTGDAGQTSLTGGARVSKADLRVEAYGTVDELNATLGMARSLCSQGDLRDQTATIQRTLFRVGSALSRPSGDDRTPSALLATDVDDLTRQVPDRRRRVARTGTAHSLTDSRLDWWTVFGEG